MVPVPKGAPFTPNFPQGCPFRNRYDSAKLLKATDSVQRKYVLAKENTDVLSESILFNAFTGKLVSQDPNEEPASALLNRIRAGSAAQSITRTPRR